MKLSVRDLDLKGRRLFLRVDFNVPLKDGVIGDDTRIRGSLPTITYALDHGATVILASHLGRPKGKPSPQLSLRPVAARLSELLGKPVIFAEDCIGDAAKRAVEAAAGAGRVVLLENLRFHPEEEANNPAFAAKLASLCDIYVNDAFGAAHRAHASTEGITHHVAFSAAGLLMEKELTYLGKVLHQPDKPFVAIIGGAKVSDKIDVIDSLLNKADAILIGGGMAYTFLNAQGQSTGKSLVETDKIDIARAALDKAKLNGVKFLLPIDHILADKFAADAETKTFSGTKAFPAEWMALDIGPKTIELFSNEIAEARTVIWNGPMGVFELPAFAHGTNAIAKAVAHTQDATTIVGGGDSVAAIHKSGFADRISHISTGGGASLEFLEGKVLPGVAALTEK